MEATLYVDLRCLQDAEYRVRGIGHHVIALLRARERSSFSNWKAIALVDPQSPALPPEIARLVDEVSACVNPTFDGRPVVFIDGTPMTHDPRFGIRFLGNPDVLCAAVVYDFIPLDWPGYLPMVASRIDYCAKLARLRAFDCFLPISDYTASRLSTLLGVSRGQIHVTGASVRHSLYELTDCIGQMSSVRNGWRPYFLMVVGPDKRKNPEAAVKAVRHLNLRQSQTISLKMAGHFEKESKRALLELAGHDEGAGFLEFFPNVPDGELAILFAAAVATIVPSHLEGFSLPVVEAAVCGCPVIASNCAAHLELIKQPEALFPSDNSAILAEKLETVINNPSLRASLVASQSHLGARFHEHAVGHRFWGALEGEVQKRNQAGYTARRQKPRLAFLSPYPPDHSEAALYTAMTMQVGADRFQTDLYTDTPGPLSFEGAPWNARAVSVAPFLRGHYDGVISVIENSPAHTRVLELFECYGGPCILHDTRLTQIYHHSLGTEKFLKFATKILGRSVSTQELNNWSQDERWSPLFLERIIERASPLMVHTATHQDLITQHYGVKPYLLPCCPDQYFKQDDLTENSKQEARKRLDIESGVFVISSFGTSVRTKGRDTCIAALELLRSWGIPAELYLIGGAKQDAIEINHISKLLGVSEYVHSIVPIEAAQRDFLLASDAGVQLRTDRLGGASTVLSNCVSAGLPSVTTADMAKSCDAPAAYTATVPDQFSHLQVAEQLALLHESTSSRSRWEDARAAYVNTHNFRCYVKRLAEILELA